MGATMPRLPSESLGLHREAVVARLAQARVTNIRVFGSIVRGEDTADSDIDLLFDPLPGASAVKLSLARLDLVDLIGCEVDPVSARAVPKRKRRILTEAIPV
jgi:uncharacterized protein